MGMYLGLQTLSDNSIDSILTCPPLIWRVVAPDDPEIFAEVLANRRKRGLFARIFGSKKESKGAPVPDLLLTEGEALHADLDKAWHGIHFLLTGSDWGGKPPLNFLILGGTEVGDIEAGYGSARLFRSSQVATINDALAGIEAGDLRNRYKPDVMMEKDIYPTIWDRDPKEDDALGYLLEYFAELKRFIGEAASKGLGLVVTIS
ncbi:MAG: YfbM family protein [Planctomycetota bacterium]|jgi:hypothetical protein